MGTTKEKVAISDARDWISAVWCHQGHFATDTHPTAVALRTVLDLASRAVEAPHFLGELHAALGWSGGTIHDALRAVKSLRRAADQSPAPIPMLLWCPECGARHIDEEEYATKAHHTHACQECGMVWRPALVPTVGVSFLPGFKNAPDTTESTESVYIACYSGGARRQQKMVRFKRGDEIRFTVDSNGVPDLETVEVRPGRKA